MKNSQKSIWVEWSRMDAAQLKYPETLHQSQNISFASFYLSKVSEILRNTPKHYFESNGDVSELWYTEIVHSGSE
jgi:hypothetical protein